MGFCPAEAYRPAANSRSTPAVDGAYPMGLSYHFFLRIQLNKEKGFIWALYFLVSPTFSYSSQTVVREGNKHLIN